MDKIDELIKALQDAKEELTKNVNCAPGADANSMAKDGTNLDNPYNEQSGHGDREKGDFNADQNGKKPELKGPVKKNDGFEALHMSANGQWSLEKASVDSQTPHTIAKLSSGGTVEHHPGGIKDGHKHADNYTIKHPKGNIHVWHDRQVKGGHQSYNQHKEDNEDDSGFAKEHANHPKIQAHIDEGIKVIKDHQMKMHGSLHDAGAKK